MPDKSLEDVLKDAYRKYDLHVGPLSSVAADVRALTTGNIAIDTIFGVGGLPLGRSVELYGPPSCGKTTTAMQAAAALQQKILAGGDPALGVGPTDAVVYCDYEHAFDKQYARNLGLDIDHQSFLFAQPDWLEQGANVVRAMVATGRIRMVIFDSVAAMTPQAAIEAETGRAAVALQARMMSDFLKTWVPLAHAHNCVGVFVNHIMELIDMGGGRRPGMPPRTSTPGGRALKFYASVRAEYQQVANVKGKLVDPITNEEQDIVIATNVRVRVVKNKVAPPFRQCVVRVRYGRGFDNFWTAMQVLLAHKRLVYSTGYFYFERTPDLAPEWMDRQVSGNHRPYIRGEEALFRLADEHLDWRADCIATAATVVGEFGSAEAVTQLVPVEPDPDDEQLVDESLLENV